MLNQSLGKLNLAPLILFEAQKVIGLNTCATVRKFLNNEDHLSYEDVEKPDRVILPRSQLYTLISIFPDATPPQQILGSKPVLWKLDSTGHSLRQSLLIIIIQLNSIQVY
jgi:hypothetical protein